MPATLGLSIRTARRAASLTQEQLGRRLGLKARAVHRWEIGASEPTRRHRREMVAIIGALNPDAAVALATALAAKQSGATAASATPAAPPTAPQINVAQELELAVFRLADELDLPPRRVRRPLARLLEHLRTATHTLETAQRQLATWIAEER